MDAPSLEWAPLTSTMAVDGEGARDDDAVSFSSDVDEPGLDADIDADVIVIFTVLILLLFLYPKSSALFLKRVVHSLFNKFHITQK